MQLKLTNSYVLFTESAHKNVRPLTENLVRQNKITRGTSDRLVHLKITEMVKWSEKLKASGDLTCD